MRTFLFISILLLSMATILSANTSPTVSNVSFTSNGTQITVTYDVTDAEEDTVTIRMKVSTDSGTTWNYNYGTATGDIGEKIPTGTGKTITFDFTGDSSTVKIKIIAYDEAAGGTDCGKVYDSSGPHEDGDDNYYYATIVIGDKCWIRDNINTGTRVDANGQETSGSSAKEKYCYKDSSSYCNTYGGLYIWEKAKIACPDGWRLPTKQEYQELLEYARNSGNELKRSGSHDGTDVSGFDAILGGDHGHSANLDEYNYIEEYGYFWTITENPDDSTKATAFRLFEGDNAYFNDNVLKTLAASVRCIKDWP